MEKIFLIPGPTEPHKDTLKYYSEYYGSSDVDTEGFSKDYDEVCSLLAEMLNIPENSSTVVMSGEGMLSLWGALNSGMKPGDKVLSINSGLYGKGIGEMAKGRGGNVEFFSTEEGTVFTIEEHWNSFETKAREFLPNMITLVHCETPTGTLVDSTVLERIGALANELDCLFYVDMVSSTGGTPIDLSKNQIDLALIGSQKCLSLHSDLSIVIVSEKAWRLMSERNSSYSGYDSLLPWKNVVKNLNDGKERLFPYTMNWSSIKALSHSLSLFKEEGFEKVYERHSQCAEYTREHVQKMGLELLTDAKICSPTVTAIKVPSHIEWKELNLKLQEQGIFFGRNYGPLENKVFRIGHMGTQANMDNVKKSINILENILAEMSK